MAARQAHHPTNPGGASSSRQSGRAFRSNVLDRIRAHGGVWKLNGGQLVLPEVFGFCRGVERALMMLDCAVAEHRGRKGRLVLLGQIIHNPWVNDYFQERGVRILTSQELAQLETAITADDCAIIPAFGVSAPIERRLKAIGCKIVDTSCGDVRWLWAWAERAVGKGYGVVILGRMNHDETVVTKSRLAEAGGHYLVIGDLKQTRQFCDLVTGRCPAGRFGDLFGATATNADSLEPFGRLAQVSQMTMLYEVTLQVRQLLHEAFTERYGSAGAAERLLFEPTVCRATQDRQAAATKLCQSGLGLVIVVGGFCSSNTRHLYELARGHVPAWFIEDARAIHSAQEIVALDVAQNAPSVMANWLPSHRPLRIGILAGASSPEIVVGQVLERLAELLC